MKIKLVKQCVAGGKPQKKGATVDVSEADAKYLILAGKAENIAKKASKND